MKVTYLTEKIQISFVIVLNPILTVKYLNIVFSENNLTIFKR